MAELSRLWGPDSRRVTTCEGFADVILNMLRELHAIGSRRDELAELIQADAADPDVQRRRKIAVLQAVTLQIRSAILLQLVTAAAAVQKATGKKYPWDGGRRDRCAYIAGCQTCRRRPKRARWLDESSQRPSSTKPISTRHQHIACFSTRQIEGSGSIENDRHCCSTAGQPPTAEMLGHRSTQPVSAKALNRSAIIC